MPANDEVDAWMERMNAFRRRLREAQGPVSPGEMELLLIEFERIMKDMHSVFREE